MQLTGLFHLTRFVEHYLLNIDQTRSLKTGCKSPKLVSIHRGSDFDEMINQIISPEFSTSL